MQVIRSIARPAANIRLTRRQFQLSKGSNIQWRAAAARSNVASVRADSAADRKKFGKRLSKQERRSVLENYVNKYLEANAGKFPTASQAKKDVGGSFYAVRQVLQELRYNYEMSPTEAIRVTSLEKGGVEDDQIVTNFGKDSQPQELGEVTNYGEASTDVNSFSSRKTRSDADSVESGQINIDPSGENKGNLHPHPHPDADVKHESTCEDNDKYDDLQPKAERQTPTKSELSERELNKELTEVSPPRESSLWQNLKSFAGGIFGRWRR